MVQSACDTGIQPDNWCPQTTEDVLPSVLGLLPPGPAFDAAWIEGTVMNGYWSAIASALVYPYQRLCAYVDEFFCATVNESRDQWIAEYALGADGCDPYGTSLCTKVTAGGGGAACADFVALAYANGWVITCTEPDPDPIAGCFEVGCTPLGLTPTLANGSNLNFGDLDPCSIGFTTVVTHPEPQFWNNRFTSEASCPVPGSNLGQGPDDEGCCFIVGYYDFDAPTTLPVPALDACQTPTNTVYFGCPASIRAPLNLNAWDTSGKFLDYGNAFIWIVTVDLAASYALQGLGTPSTAGDTESNAGNFVVGCTPLDTATPPDFILCFLQMLAPAHTTLITETINP